MWNIIPIELLWKIGRVLINPDLCDIKGMFYNLQGGTMLKKIAVLVRDRQAEALRMAVGLILANNEVTVFVMDNELDESDPSISLNLETLSDLDIKVFSNNPANKFEQMSTEDIARALLNYDSALPY
jgi:hypothetical protein